MAEDVPDYGQAPVWQAFQALLALQVWTVLEPHGRQSPGKHSGGS
jgi:hypothetical protein